MCSCFYCFFHLHTTFKKVMFFCCTWGWWSRRWCWWSRWWTKMTTRIHRTRSMLLTMFTVCRLNLIINMTMTFCCKILNIFFNNTIKFKNCFTNNFTIIWWRISCRWWNRYWMNRLWMKKIRIQIEENNLTHKIIIK
jgi:hypothetical protein